MNDEVRRDDDGGVITVTFTRDHKANAATKQMLDAIVEAANDLAYDVTKRVLVITGEGRYFTAGLDITTMQQDLGLGPDGVVRSSTARQQYRNQARHDFFDYLEQIEKPIVLAAQGHCMGLGIEMGVSCDFRFAASGVRMGLPEIATLAVVPGSGGISRLVRIIGPHWAKWLVTGGQTITSEKALEIGLLHDVFPAEVFNEKVREFAHHIASLPGEAVGLSKMAIDAAVNADRRTSRDFDRLVSTILFSSVDFVDRQKAFGQR